MASDETVGRVPIDLKGTEFISVHIQVRDGQDGSINKGGHFIRVTNDLTKTTVTFPLNRADDITHMVKKARDRAYDRINGTTSTRNQSDR